MSICDKTTPCLVTIGLSGAGKSTSNEWIERHYCAQRVRRFTTRPSRLDDADLVVHMDSPAAEPNDFIYYGWGDTIYWIHESDIIEIQKKQVAPLVELGDVDDAVKFRARFSPTVIVCLWRDLAVESMKRIFKKRKMKNADIQERISSAQSDLKALQMAKRQFDFNLYNDMDKDTLFHQWNVLLNKIGIAKR